MIMGPAGQFTTRLSSKDCSRHVITFGNAELLSLILTESPEHEHITTEWRNTGCPKTSCRCETVLWICILLCLALKI